MNQKTAKKVVWVTGASSGIGLALTKRYLEAGWRVLASARKPGELTPLLDKHEHLAFIEFDIADDSQIDSVRAALAAHSDCLDCAVLNAGTCEYLDMSDIDPDWKMMDRIMSVNFFGLVNSVDVCLPLLKKSSRPHLVGVSSQAVQAAFPQAEAYGASKAAVRYFLSSLRMDLKPFNIDVTCLLPGFVDTPLTQKNSFSMPFLMSADDAAKRMFSALESRPFEFAFPKRLSAMLWAGRHFPKLWLTMLAPKKER
ncbi:SDR family NAD(P)-dependent oxidoreductase [Marinomonas sp. M1K-6]|uniref:SDR family NAD(P)-dependent oxidoreductase n=1 Tax=Marinomonas profundi TaxID=2726122 RepID=A0A847RC45_9GAMM|nr:SDR family NAD(P)-dependent oxidoreductase [Marinomonas profundi]NLQ18857.1 SDR family NAD(P)-dependent oxidoreductase [Marinomonas profundi]UDV01784.1 SDR family NAD(P)-dependent oxidoreductase [Marinomonas profundi]